MIRESEAPAEPLPPIDITINTATQKPRAAKQYFRVIPADNVAVYGLTEG